MEDLKVVYWAENQVEADLICGMMKECGIPCKQMKESLGKSLGLQFGILGGCLKIRRRCLFHRAVV